MGADCGSDAYVGIKSAGKGEPQIITGPLHFNNSEMIAYVPSFWPALTVTNPGFYR